MSEAPTAVAVNTTESISEVKYPIEREWNGLTLVIEVGKGQSRPMDDGGSMYMFADYGFVKDSPSMEEGEGLDVFINPVEEEFFPKEVFVVGMLSEDGVLEEEKCFLEFLYQKDVRTCFTSHYPSEKLGYIYSMSIPDFRAMVMARSPEAVLKAADKVLEDPFEEVAGVETDPPPVPELLETEKSIRVSLLDIGKGLNHHQLLKCIEARRSMRGA